jgi:hypothetical protein
MKQIMECLLVETRKIHGLVEAGQEMNIKMKANWEKIDQDQKNKEGDSSIMPFRWHQGRFSPS